MFPPPISTQPAASGRLTLTISRKALYYDLAATAGRPVTVAQAILLLALCALTAESVEPMYVSREPGHEDGLSGLPYAADFAAFHVWAAEWADTHFPPHAELALLRTSQDLWDHHHATLPIIEDDAEKKTMNPSAASLPTGQNPSPTTSAAATSPGAATFSMLSPSATPTPPSTPATPQQASPASPPPPTSTAPAP